VAGNELFRHFLGARLEEAYAAMRRDRDEDRLQGLVSLAFYFFSTGQRESGRTFLEKHVTDEKERGDIEAAFSAIIRVPWKASCGCNKGWACVPKVGLCQPKGVAKAWADWPRVMDVEVVSASIAGGSSGGTRRSFWDQDGSAVDPFVELAFDEAEILKTPVAENNYTPTWGFKTSVTLYPYSTLKLTLKDKDRAFDQLIAMKTLKAPDIFKQANKDGLLKLKLRRVKELVLSFVERLPRGSAR
jgi:C2 domain